MHMSFVLALVVGGWLSLSVPATAAAAENGGGIVVDVTDDAPAPSPTPSRPAPAGSPGAGTVGGQGAQSGSGTTGTTGGVQGGQSDPLPGTRVGLAVGGITSEISPDFSAGNGSVTLTVVVRNTSSQAFDADARFVLVNFFGGTIGEADAIAVGALEPDQSRAVTATIDSPGQGILVRGSVTITPPEKVGDTPLSPVTREALIFTPPLFSLVVIGGVSGAGAAAWWLVIRARREELAAASLLGGGA